MSSSENISVEYLKMVASDEFFAKVEARLAKVDKANRKPEMLKTFKFQVTDNSGSVLKTWFLDLVNVTLEVADKGADCTWIISETNLLDIGNSKLSIQDAIDGGKLKLQGNKDLAPLLAPFVSTL